MNEKFRFEQRYKKSIIRTIIHRMLLANTKVASYQNTSYEYARYRHLRAAY